MLVVMLTSVSASAQMQLFDPVSWSTSVEQVGDGEYRIDFKATIEQGWHLYDLGPYEGGPLATTFTFDPIVGYELVGEVEPNRESVRQMDEIFEMEIGHYEGEVVFSQRVKAPQGATVQCSVEWQACSDQCVNGDKDFSIKVGNPAAVAEVDIEQSVADANAVTKGGSIWSFILSAMGWALIALLTPCVFPMVPMTVSFFIKGSGSKAQGRFRATMYGLFIIALYVLPIAALILITRFTGGDSVTEDIFNWLSTHWIPNIIFFVIFMIFAASFFGAFEITLPSSLVNKSDAGAEKGGLIGIFFMALTLVLVSFSCTGPIVGSVIIESMNGGIWMPIITMAAFATAFALPFTLLAWFPSMLKNMPKSGGWLNSVKVVLGFIEVARGLKFLMTADQTYHWGILDREIYLAIWIVVFSLLGLYLLGKLRFAHDDKMETLSVKRLAMAIVVFSFVVYMIPGMFGAPLNAVSGYIPPMSTQDYQVNGRVENVNAGRKYADFLHLPHQLEGHFDFEEAVEAATAANKPIFVDVTGHACNNCREMETMVWSNDQVLPMLKNDFVICALYVDDMTKIEGGKRLGSVNSKFAQDRWGVNAQPGYILLSPDGETVLAGPRGYNTDIEAFVEFLKKGKNGVK